MFCLPSQTGCKGGQILVGSNIWPQSFLSLPLSVSVGNSSEAGVRQVFKSFYPLTFKRFEPPFSFPSNGSNHSNGSNAPFKGAQ